MKERLDVLLVNLGYAPSREKAKAVIMSGCVYVNGQKEDKAGTMFDTYAAIEVRGNSLKYVSRGGLKLEKAMEEFAIALDQKTCMDVGASTGGFTDCMLQNGAVKVFAVAIHKLLVKNEACRLKGLHLFWNMVDGREKTDLYTLYEQTIGELELPLMKVFIPDTKRFKKELDAQRKTVFRSTLFPADKRLVKGSNMEELITEIAYLIKL